MIGFGTGVSFRGGMGGIAPPPAGPQEPGDTGGGGDTGGAGIAALPVTPTARWHPAYATVAQTAGRIVSASDEMAFADLTEGGPGLGPLALTDANGQDFWRFEGDAYLNVAGSLVSDSRDMSVFMVGRVPRHPTSWNRYFSIGNVAQGTTVNTGNAPLESRIVSQSAGHLSSFGKNAYTASSGAEWMVPGAQMQVMGAVTSATGSRLFLNERFVDVATPYNRTGVVGGEIGRYAHSPGSQGNWGVFDLYEMVVFTPALTQAEGLAVSQALMAAHGVVPVQNQLVLEGDSIMQGTDDVTPALSAAAILTNPGDAHIPDGWRVINKGTSGNQVGDLVTKRDTGNGWAAQVLPGRNVLAFEIGRNDFAAGGRDAVQHYANVTGYLNTATTGVLPRGWEVRVMANIAGSPSHMDKITDYRAALRSPQFLSDTSSGPGQSFDGQVSIISTDLITYNGETVFADAADAADTTYYAGDSTHPDVLGAQLRITGGDTPQYGVAAGL